MKENLNIELLNNFGDCSEDGHRLFSNVGSRARVSPVYLKISTIAFLKVSFFIKFNDFGTRVTTFRQNS